MSFPLSSGWTTAIALYYVAVNVLTHYHKIAGAVGVGAGLLFFRRPLGQLLGATLVGSWKQLNEEAALARREQPARSFDYRPLVVLCTSAVSLTFIEYFGQRDLFWQAAARWFPSFIQHRYYELAGYVFWSGARLLGYAVLPWLAVLCLPGERLRDYGLSVQGVWRHLWIYLVLFMIVLLPVAMVSYTKSFQSTYPFYRLAVRSWFDYVAWEALYALQFFGLEVFFRGFMLHPLKRVLGAYAIFAMVVPYCMIHYGKPLPEVLGAIVAGTVLGTLSLRTGSIWCGVLLHVSVALTMDTLSLLHKVGYPGHPRLVP